MNLSTRGSLCVVGHGEHHLAGGLAVAQKGQGFGDMRQIGAVRDPWPDAPLPVPAEDLGEPRCWHIRHIPATVFNYQTHRRGQVHALLKEAGVEPPALDLPDFLGSLKRR